MSEYQYYEFLAIDRPLGRKEMGELRRLSTRAEITPTSFVNTYDFGDFKGDPRKLMWRYFDAFVYYANWGTRQFMLRLPRGPLDEKAAAAYGAGDAVSVEAKGEVGLLKDLRDLIVQPGELEAFEARVRDIRKRHASKSALLNRMSKAGLLRRARAAT